MVTKPRKLPEIIKKQPKTSTYHSTDEIIYRDQTVLDQRPATTEMRLPELERIPLTTTASLSDVEFATRIFEKYDEYFISRIEQGNVVTTVPKLPVSRKPTRITDSKEQVYFTDTKRLAAEYITKKVDELKEQEKILDYRTIKSRSIDALQAIQPFDSDRVSKQRSLEQSLKHLKYEVDSLISPLTTQTTKLDTSVKRDFRKTTVTGSTTVIDQQLLSPKLQKYEEIKMFRDNTQQAIEVIQKSRDLLTKREYVSESVLSQMPSDEFSAKQILETKLKQLQKLTQEKEIDRERKIDIKTYMQTVKGPKIPLEITRDVQMISEGPKFEIYKVPKPVDTRLDSYKLEDHLSTIAYDVGKRTRDETISLIKPRKDIKTYETYETEQRIDTTLISKKKEPVLQETISKIRPTPVKKQTKIKPKSEVLSQVDVELVSREGPELDIYKIPKPTDLTVDSREQPSMISKKLIEIEEEKRRAIESIENYYDIYKVPKHLRRPTDFRREEFKSEIDLKRIAVDTISKAIKPEIKKFKSVDQIQRIEYDQYAPQPRDVDLTSRGLDLEIYKIPKTTSLSVTSIQRKPEETTIFRELRSRERLVQKATYEAVIVTLQQPQVITTVRLPEFKKYKPLTPIKPKFEDVSYSQIKKAAVEFITKTVTPMMQSEQFYDSGVGRSKEEFMSTVYKTPLLTTKVKQKPRREAISVTQIMQAPHVHREFFEESHVISAIQQGQIRTEVSLPDIKRVKPLTPIKPKEQVTYTAEKTLAAEYISKTLHPYIEIEKIEQPKQYETVISKTQQGQIRTEVSLPDLKHVKPLTPIKPKEHITYTVEKTLAAEYISKALHPYIEVEKIEQPKQFDETVSTIFQQTPLITEKRPEKVYDEHISTIQQDKTVTEATLPDIRKQVAAQIISEAVQPLVRQEHYESRIRQGDVITKVRLPERTKLVKHVRPKEEEVMYSSTTVLDSPLITQSVEKYKQTQIFVSVIQQGQVLTQVRVPEIARLQPTIPVYPKEEVSYTATKKLAAQFISKTIAPYVEIEKIEQPKQYESVISTIQQGQVLTKVSLPERAQPLVPVRPKEHITYTAEKTLAAEYISKTLHPYIEVEKIEQPKQFDEVISTIQQKQVLTQVQLPSERVETICEYNFNSF